MRIPERLSRIWARSSTYTIRGRRYEIQHGGVSAQRLAELAVEEWWRNLDPDLKYDEVDVLIDDNTQSWGTFKVLIHTTYTFEATRLS